MSVPTSATTVRRLWPYGDVSGGQTPSMSAQLNRGRNNPTVRESEGEAWTP